MDKEDIVQIYNGILLSSKEERNNATGSNMEGPRDYHTKCSKSEKRNTTHHLYVDSKKMIQMNLATKQKQTCKHRK